MGVTTQATKPTEPARSFSRLNRKEAANFLAKQGYPIAARTLTRLAALDRGPPFRRFGYRNVVYESDTLLAWAEKYSTYGGEREDLDR